MPATGTSFARWASLLAEHARRPDVVDQADAWKQAAPVSGPGPAAGGAPRAGHLRQRRAACRLSLDAETTRLLLAEVPAAFHAGVHDILLIGFALAWAEFLVLRALLAPAATRSALTSRATDATRNWAPMWALWTCRAPWGGSPPSTRCPWGAGPGGWAVLGAGARRRGRLGGTDQGRQRAAARPAGPPDLWPAAVPEHRRRPRGVRPADRVQLSGAPGRVAN